MQREQYPIQLKDGWQKATLQLLSMLSRTSLNTQIFHAVSSKEYWHAGTHLQFFCRYHAYGAWDTPIEGYSSMVLLENWNNTGMCICRCIYVIMYRTGLLRTKQYSSLLTIFKNFKQRPFFHLCQWHSKMMVLNNFLPRKFKIHATQMQSYQSYLNPNRPGRI